MSKLEKIDLENTDRFRLVRAFEIDKTMEFIVEVLGFKSKNSRPSKKAKIFMMLFGALIGGIISFIGMKTIGEGFYFKPIWGFFGFFVLVLPLHEWIHGLTFKAMGAKDVGYGFSFKSGMVYAYAQDFVVNMKELAIVAIMPFTLLTPLLIGFYIFLPFFRIETGLILFMHTLGCLGDFALFRYATLKNNQKQFTYDDIRYKGMTYYYEEI
jgi:hypothetical protein